MKQNAARGNQSGAVRDRGNRHYHVIRNSHAHAICVEASREMGCSGAILEFVVSQIAIEGEAVVTGFGRPWAAATTDEDQVKTRPSRS